MSYEAKSVPNLVRNIFHAVLGEIEFLKNGDTVSLSYWFGDCFCGSFYPSMQ